MLKNDSIDQISGNSENFNYKENTALFFSVKMDGLIHCTLNQTVCLYYGFNYFIRSVMISNALTSKETLPSQTDIGRSM